jgi:hypothetical protein
MIGGRVLDATAIHDLTIGRTVYGAAFLAAANDVGITLALPAAALQEAWATADDQDYPFLDLLLGLPLTVVDPLDAERAQRSGILARDAHAGGRWDAGAAHTVMSAVDRGWPVLTADPAPLRAIDVAVEIEALPEV